LRIFIVDAFTDQPYKGNPAAVCVLDRERPERWMQRVANEMNCSETAFALRMGDEYSLRWFTPETEVDLCGHATLATAHLLWEEGLHEGDEIAFHTRSGRLTAERDGEWIRLDFPADPAVPAEAPEDLTEGLGSAALVYVGKGGTDLVVELEDEAAVARLRPNLHAWKRLDARGVLVTARSGRPNVDFVSRCFFPAIGIDEDPVTGSAHCTLGPYWAAKLGRTELTAMQLSAREGLLRLRVGTERVQLTGRAVTTLRGELAAERL